MLMFFCIWANPPVRHHNANMIRFCPMRIRYVFCLKNSFLCVLGFYGGLVVLHLPDFLATWIWIGLGWCLWGEQIRWWSYLLPKNEVNYNHFAIDDAILFSQFLDTKYIKLVSWPTQNSWPPPPHDSPPNPILPYFQYMQLTLVTPKRVRSCVETQIFGSEVGGHMGWGRNGHAFHAHPLLFPTSFLY
jgi:hypothetical protein